VPDSLESSISDVIDCNRQDIAAENGLSNFQTWSPPKEIGQNLKMSQLFNASGDAAPVKDYIDELCDNMTIKDANLVKRQRTDDGIGMIAGTSIIGYRDPQFYACAFPTLFPLGVGTPNGIRPVPLTVKEYAKHALLLSSDKFKRHLRFQFAIYDQIRKHELFSSVLLHVTHAKKKNHITALNNITVSQLKEALELRNSGDAVPYNHPTRPLMDSLRLIGSQTNYSDTFKFKARNEIRSCIIHHGAPSLYITISPLDHKNILAFQICDRRASLNLDNLPPEISDPQFRLKQASENPVSLSQFFYILIRNILGKLFKGDNKDKGGIFGPLAAYYGMVEAQNRGTLHIHLMLWIKGAPTPDVLFEKLSADPTFQASLFSYLNSIIKNDLDDYQHQTSETETQSYIPVTYAPCLQDCSPCKLSKFLNEAIPEYQTHAHCPSCFKNPRTKGRCRYRKPDKVTEQNHFDFETGDIHLKRSHPMINAFNPYLTAVANCNTDISFLFRCKSVTAIIHYITMYITKSDDQVDNFYALMAAAKQSLVDIPMSSCSTANLTEAQFAARALLLRLYQKIHTCSQLPANIVSTLLLDLPMSYKTEE
jgi:hypothetical protein